MKYIGPFFRMNTLSQDEINTQLFFFAKEAVKTIVLESKCGLASSIKNYKRLSSNNDISINSNFSPLLCVYRKASPNFIHSKNSNGFDEDSFRKEIIPTTNALMTLSLLELTDYYRNYKNIDKNQYALYEIYKKLTKEQLDFYSINLRSAEGTFISKKNISESNYKNFSLVDKDKKFKFSDQAFMMVAYYLFSLKNPTDDIADAYKAFALEILQMFMEYKEKIYDCSLDEICKILLAFNALYSYDQIDDLKTLIMDLADYAMNKFDEKDYYVEEIDTVSLCSIILSLSYKHTNIINFFDKSTEIINKLFDFYDSDSETFYKLSSKKEVKYSCLDINFYLLAFMVYSSISKDKNKYKSLISSIYKKFFISSGIITSWPEAPTLDDFERYRGLTLKSSDMLNETYFKMPAIQTPNSVGIAPIFLKSINYNRHKDEFSSSKLSFDSYKNFLLFYLYIFLFKNNYIDLITVTSRDTEATRSNETINEITNDSSSESEITDDSSSEKESAEPLEETRGDLSNTNKDINLDINIVDDSKEILETQCLPDNNVENHTTETIENNDVEKKD